MNNMKSVLREMQDRFNSRNLPTTDTLNGIKTAITMDSEIRKAISLQKQKEQTKRVEPKDTIVTGDELRAYFEKGKLQTDTKENLEDRER